jgi:hypothetical protein
LTGVLFDPKATYEDIAAKPSWALPLVIIVAISLVIVAAYGQRVGWRGLVEKRMAESSRTADMPADQREQAVERGAKIAPIFGYVAVLIGTPVVALIIAAILMLIMNLVAGARATFVQSLSVLTHSWVPGIIGGLIGLIMIFVKAPDTIDLDHLVAANVGAFLASDSPKWLMSLGTSLDIFQLWSIVLLGFGFSAINPKKISVGKGIAIVAISWAIYLGMKVAAVAAFS